MQLCLSGEEVCMKTEPHYFVLVVLSVIVSNFLYETRNISFHFKKNILNVNSLNTCTVHNQFCCTQLHKLGSTIFNIKIKIQLPSLKDRKNLKLSGSQFHSCKKFHWLADHRRFISAINGHPTCIQSFKNLVHVQLERTS